MAVSDQNSISVLAEAERIYGNRSCCHCLEFPLEVKTVYSGYVVNLGTNGC